MTRPLTIAHFHSHPWAGVPYRMEVAARRAGLKTFRIQTRARVALSMGFPAGDDLSWNAANDAHVYHAHGLDALAYLHKSDLLRKRPTLLTIHGTPDRREIDRLELAQNVAAVHIVTPDLFQWYPDAVFIPNWISSTAEGDPPDFKGHGLYRPVGHKEKNHKEFDAVERKLIHDGCGPIFVQRGEGGSVRNEVALDAMRKRSMVWDHLHGYFGVTTVEAWSQGCVSIVTPSETCRAHCAEFFGEMPPFPSLEFKQDFGLQVTPLYRWISDLLGDKAQLLEDRERCYNFWASRWRESHLFPHLESIYRRIAA